MKPILKCSLFLLTALPLFALCQVPTSYDSDGDGIPDSVDQCMYVKGIAKFNGCPVQKKITDNDIDGDGIANNEDACPDLFGNAANKGCPEMKSGSGTSSYYGASYGSDQSAEAAASSSLFTTTSSAEQSEMTDFKEKIKTAIADSKNNFADIKSASYEGARDSFSTNICLPGASSCYIATGAKKVYYADFGTYTDGALACDKADELKKDILLSLGENDWHYSMLGKNGYVEEYQAWKKTDSIKYPRVRTFVQKVKDTYNVYLTIEEI